MGRLEYGTKPRRVVLSSAVLTGVGSLEREGRECSVEE
jgi:hypothetical protein